tara:strand:+ start:2919 stop:3416 length:498 start_codon:yes stop_codon:yes gene_type:complete
VKEASSAEKLCSGIHHPAIVVPDLSGAIAFYEAALGGELIKQSAWDHGTEQFDALTGLKDSAAAFCLLRFGHSFLEMFEYDSSRRHDWRTSKADELGIRHLAFQVNDLQIAEAKFIAAGGSTVGEAIHVKGGGSARYCRDPYGNIVELLVPGGKMPPLGEPDSAK